MKISMISDNGKEHGFDRLFDAVQFAPEKVAALVSENPDILKCKNYSGETVLNFFSLEGDIEIIKQLISYGARVDEFCISDALEYKPQLIVLHALFEAGGVPDTSHCAHIINREVRKRRISKKTKVKLKRLFHDYGYTLET